MLRVLFWRTSEGYMWYILETYEFRISKTVHNAGIDIYSHDMFFNVPLLQNFIVKNI